MVCIWEKFRAAIHKDVPLKIIWDHLESMYDLMALVSDNVKKWKSSDENVKYFFILFEFYFFL